MYTGKCHKSRDFERNYQRKLWNQKLLRYVEDKTFLGTSLPRIEFVV